MKYTAKISVTAFHISVGPQLSSLRLDRRFYHEGLSIHKTSFTIACSSVESGFPSIGACDLVKTGLLPPAHIIPKDKVRSKIPVPEKNNQKNIHKMDTTLENQILSPHFQHILAILSQNNGSLLQKKNDIGKT